MGKRQAGTEVTEFMAETTLGPDLPWVEWMNEPASARAASLFSGCVHPMLLRLELLKFSLAWVLP